MIERYKIRVLKILYSLVVFAVVLWLMLQTFFPGGSALAWVMAVFLAGGVVVWAWLWNKWLRCPYCGDHSFQLQYALIRQDKPPLVCPCCGKQIMVQ